MTLGRRRLLVGLGALGAIGAAALLFADGDERRIRRQLAEAEAALESPANEDPAARWQRVQRALADLVADDVLVRIPEHPEIGRGRAELARVASRAGADPRGLAITARNLEVRFEPARRAALATFSAELSRPGDELHKHVRDVRLRLEQREGGWRVTSVESAPQAQAEPEARP
jgi:hypothetical protein